MSGSFDARTAVILGLGYETLAYPYTLLFGLRIPEFRSGSEVFTDSEKAIISAGRTDTNSIRPISAVRTHKYSIISGRKITMVFHFRFNGRDTSVVRYGACFNRP